MNAGSPLATLFSSMWLCDDQGDVYVLKNLDKYVDSCVVNLQHKSYLAVHDSRGLPAPPTPPDLPSLEWSQVGTKFSSVAAGFEGLVCGLKDTELFIRVGVSSAVPQGTAWTKVICEATQIAVGRDCIARRTITGRLFASNVRKEYSSCSASNQSLVLSWTPISMGGLEELLSQQKTPETAEDLEHFLLDEQDRLFIVTRAGWVYTCFNPCLEENAGWITVAEPPSVKAKLNASWVYNLFWPQKKEGFFRQVCAGRGSLWCARPSNCDLSICQLVVSDFVTSGGVSELRTNWTLVAVPTKDERAVLLAASKNTVDGIYTVMKKNSNGRIQIVAFSLNQADSSRVDIPLPSPHDPQSLEISLCSSAPHSMLYPSVRRTESDVCCEYGDCDFCRNAQVLVIPSSSIIPNQPLDSRLRQEHGSSSILGKRAHPDLQLPEAAIGNGNDPELIHEVKKRRVEHTQFSALIGIDNMVKLNTADHLAKV